MKGMKVIVIYVSQNASVSQWSCFQKVEDTEIHLKYKQFQSWSVSVCNSGYPKQIMKFHGCFFGGFFNQNYDILFQGFVCWVKESIKLKIY